MPFLYIGVPYADGDFKGKVLYTSDQATDLELSIVLGLDLEIDGIKYINEDISEKKANATPNLDALKKILEIFR